MLNKIQISDCEWYHQTNLSSAKNIVRNGFIIEHGGDQRFTEGIYFLSKTGANFGDTTIKACIKGDFLEVRNFPFDDWRKIKLHYAEKIRKDNNPYNYEVLTDYMKKDYPNFDGLVFTEDNGKRNYMAVVWNPNISIPKEKLKIL